MSSLTFLYIFVAILAIVFLLLNFIFAPHNPYQEKYSIFECGFHSFLGQNRTQFGIKFFIFALVYLLLDLEILVIYPFGVSEYENGVYGLIVVLIFITIITIGFVFELGKNALKIDSRQSLVTLFKTNIFVNTLALSNIITVSQKNFLFLRKFSSFYLLDLNSREFTTRSYNFSPKNLNNNQGKEFPVAQDFRQLAADSKNKFPSDQDKDLEVIMMELYTRKPETLTQLEARTQAAWKFGKSHADDPLYSREYQTSPLETLNETIRRCKYNVTDFDTYIKKKFEALNDEHSQVAKAYLDWAKDNNIPSKEMDDKLYLIGRVHSQEIFKVNGFQKELKEEFIKGDAKAKGELEAKAEKESNLKSKKPKGNNDESEKGGPSNQGPSEEGSSCAGPADVGPSDTSEKPPISPNAEFSITDINDVYILGKPLEDLFDKFSDNMYIIEYLTSYII